METPSRTLGERLRRYFFFRLPVYLFVIGIGYVLSIGPMFWQWHEATYSGDRNRYITQLYFPLAWLCDKSQVIGDIFDWYINLWIG